MELESWPQGSAEVKRCVIIGAGPAGLTAAYELSQAKMAPLVFEQDTVVGGIARTVEHAGYRFDIGGHRFFTKVQSIDDWWRRVLGSDLLVRARQSRIYYDGKFYDYPLKPLNAIIGLGPVETFRIGLSYLSAQLFPYPVENNLEEWVSNRFGRRLYEIFFKNYTEKVWGMKCTEIGADWAAQRIKNLDLNKLVKDMFLGTKKNEITTLITSFLYPRLGPGMLWEKVAQSLEKSNAPVRLGYRVTKLHLEDNRIVQISVNNGAGNEARIDGDQFISSMPIKDLIAAFDPPPPAPVIEAARKLRYRDFLTVGIIVNKPDVFNDNWIYIHSPKVKVGRIQNFKNWSPEMVADPSYTSLGLEYFVQEGDELWSADDKQLIQLAVNECSELGLIDREDFVDGVVIRMPKAYPVYDRTYKDNLSVIREYVASIENLQLIGRNGQHRYNNQDHSMLTGVFAAQNICGAAHDLWNVNVEDEYHEAGPRQGRRGEQLVPAIAVQNPLSLLQSAFARYDPIALACALSVVPAIGLFLLVLPALARSERNSMLLLLRNYLFGFDVSLTGAAIGILQVSILGLVLGFVMAHAINFVVAWHERRLFRKLELMETLSAPAFNWQ
jgi:protoporphyrinogen oxidase